MISLRRSLYYTAAVIFCTTPWPSYSNEVEDAADERLMHEVINNGTAYFKEADNETKFPDSAVMVALLRQRRFADLAARFLQYDKAPALPDGNMPLYRFLEFPPLSFDDVVYLDEWCKRSPDSPYPFIMRGSFYLQAAWKARGYGFSSTVNNDQREKFKSIIKTAGTDLKTAQRIAPSNKLVYIFLVDWAGCGGSDLREAEYFFNKGSQIIKEDPALYYNMFFVYSPKWHGNREVMLNFARKSAAQHPDELGYLVGCAHEELAWKTIGYADNNKAFFDYFRTPGVWEEIFDAYKPVLKKHPQSKRRRVQLFKFAVYADRINELWSWLKKERLE